MMDESNISLANRTDAELIELALCAGDLTPQGRATLIAQLESRLCGLELLPALRAHIETPTAEEIDALVERTQRLPCPVCDNRWTRLNAFIIERKTLDLVAFYEMESYLFIACQPCMTQEGHPTSPRLLPDAEWKPSETFEQFVRSHAPLLLYFDDRPDLVHTLLSLDYPLFFDRIEAPDHELIRHIESTVIPDPSTLQGALRESHSEAEASDWRSALQAAGIRSVVSEHDVPGSRNVVYHLDVQTEHRTLALQILESASAPGEEAFCYFCGAGVSSGATRCPECDADLSDED